VGGQPVAVDEQLPQIPVVVGKRIDHGPQPGAVLLEAHRVAVDLDVLVDELAELLEAMVVAALQIAPVEGDPLRALRLHPLILAGLRISGGFQSRGDRIWLIG
jgi:hypothetical protein